MWLKKFIASPVRTYQARVKVVQKANTKKPQKDERQKLSMNDVFFNISGYNFGEKAKITRSDNKKRVASQQPFLKKNMKNYLLIAASMAFNRSSKLAFWVLSCCTSIFV
jgi:hypothetical protein